MDKFLPYGSLESGRRPFIIPPGKPMYRSMGGISLFPYKLRLPIPSVLSEQPFRSTVLPSGPEILNLQRISNLRGITPQQSFGSQLALPGPEWRPPQSERSNSGFSSRQSTGSGFRPSIIRNARDVPLPPDPRPPAQLLPSRRGLINRGFYDNFQPSVRTPSASTGEYYRQSTLGKSRYPLRGTPDEYLPNEGFLSQPKSTTQPFKPSKMGTRAGFSYPNFKKSPWSTPRDNMIRKGSESGLAWRALGLLGKAAFGGGIRRMITGTLLGGAIGAGTSDAVSTEGKFRDMVKGGLIGFGAGALTTRTGINSIIGLGTHGGKLAARGLLKGAYYGARSIPAVVGGAARVTFGALERAPTLVGGTIATAGLGAMMFSGPPPTTPGKRIVYEAMQNREAFMGSTDGVVQGLHSSRHGGA